VNHGLMQATLINTLQLLLTSMLVKIKVRLQELRAESKSKAVMTVDRRKERLSEFAEETIEGKFGVTRQFNIAAIAELNKMDGSYAPTKTEGTLNINVWAGLVKQVAGEQTTKELTDGNPSPHT
jgi:hypothetical protein